MISKISLALAVLSVAEAFMAPSTHQTRLSALSMAEEDPTILKSVLKKQIAYDDDGSRFFETTIDEEDCIPDEEFCVTDSETGELIRLTVEEKERIFLDAMQAYYSSGRKILEDEEFDLLKEDLTWSGSKAVVMNRKETAYLAAMTDYLKGTPSLSDAEFDALKAELLEEKSKFAVQTEPTCYIDTGICKVTLTEDTFKTNLLYLPAGFVTTLLWVGLTFELLNPLIAVNPLVLAIVGSPFIYTASKTITEGFLFENLKIARGPCPSCGFENTVYFGNILGVEGYSDVASVKCPNCKEVFSVQRNNFRASTLPKQ